MDNKIKNSYSNIKMPEEAREKIYRQIIESDTYESSGQKKKSIRKKAVLSGWRMGIVACLGAALIIPTCVYAAGKISEYINVNIRKNNYQVSVEMQKQENTQDVKTNNSKMSYIQVKADFGSEYKLDKTGGGFYGYAHKDGFESGKSLFYEVLYMDVRNESILNLYNQKSTEEININGHKALFCESNVVQGSRYNSDNDTVYTLHVYVFYDEYGYIINYGAMQGLGKERLISLVNKTTVTKVSREDAADYGLLSQFVNANTETADYSYKGEIRVPINGENEIIRNDGLTYQITDVKISSQVEEYDTGNPKQTSFLERCRGLWDENGKLKPYIREEIKYGDGIFEAERTVTGEEEIQPKMVCVTMKVEGSGDFQLPSVRFLEKEGQKYYDTGKYSQYNRPEEIKRALVDDMPCYFKESNGGKGYWIKELKEGEEQIFHFAYIIDEDMTDSMFLYFYNSSCPNGQYIDISR